MTLTFINKCSHLRIEVKKLRIFRLMVRYILTETLLLVEKRDYRNLKLRESNKFLLKRILALFFIPKLKGKHKSIPVGIIKEFFC